MNEDKPKLASPQERLLEHLLDNHPATPPPGAPEGAPPSVNVQVTLKGGMTTLGNVRRGPIQNMYTMVVMQRDQHGKLLGSADLYFTGDDLLLVVRPHEEGTPNVVLANPGDLPPGMRVRR